MSRVRESQPDAREVSFCGAFEELSQASFAEGDSSDEVDVVPLKRTGYRTTCFQAVVIGTALALVAVVVGVVAGRLVVGTADEATFEEKEVDKITAMDVDESLRRKNGNMNPLVLEESVNMASLGGALWYLHNEIVSHCPRKFEITRLLRYKVMAKATQPLYDLGMNFGVRYAFDSGRCTGPWDCDCDSWRRFGYIVGCNDLTRDRFPFPTWTVEYPNAIWYSVPGKCPSQTYMNKGERCFAREPGGICDGPPTGKGDCTISIEPAGDIRIDDVVGIRGDDALHSRFCHQGCVEYDFGRDGGRCTSFWDHQRSSEQNQQRYGAFADAFASKYPDSVHDRDMRPPKCDFNRGAFFQGTKHSDLEADDLQQDVAMMDAPALDVAGGVDPRIGNRSHSLGISFGV